MPVTAKRFADAELIDSAFHRFDRSLWQWLGHIADATTNKAFRRFWMRFAEFTDPARDFRKQIARLKLEVVFVQVSHDGNKKRGDALRRLPNYGTTRRSSLHHR